MSDTEHSQEAKKQPENTEEAVEEICIVVHNFHYNSNADRQKRQRDEATFLELTKGDVVKVMQKVASGWWLGAKFDMLTKKQEGEPGWFPGAYVKAHVTTFIPAKKDATVEHFERLAQNPADLRHFAYTQGLTATQTAAMGTKDTHFLGQPLMENAKDEYGPAEKDCRVMGQFFDYDRWNEDMNRKDQRKRKAKPNPRMKKEKKIRW